VDTHPPTTPLTDVDHTGLLRGVNGIESRTAPLPEGICSPKGRRPWRRSLAALALAAPGFAMAQIYSSGSGEAVVLSNFRSMETPVLLELASLIADVAEQADVAPELLHAVIAAESRYDRRAVSPKGAIGLMQLLPSTARRFGASDPYSPRQNILAGAHYLKWLMALFENDLELVLAAYNAGEQAVLKAGRRIPPFAETQAYVPKVLAYLRCASAPACKPA